MIRSSVLFPQPLGPTTETNSPSSTARLTSLNASVPDAYRLKRCSIEIDATVGHLRNATRRASSSEVRRDENLATQKGLEPSTSAVTGRRSNQLSYCAKRTRFMVGTVGIEPTTPRV